MNGLRIEHPVDGVALVTLDRPEKMNALNDELVEAIPEVFAAFELDDGVRSVVVTGAGRGFCAGGDFFGSSGFSRPSTLESERFLRRSHRGPVNIRRLSKPTIAAVNGAAAGAGFGLALACDLRLGSPNARFSAPFVQMGLAPDYGVTYFLPRLVGTAVALDILLTGRPIEAEEALRIGLISRVCDDVVAEAVDLAHALAGNPPAAMALTRANVYKAADLSVEDAILQQDIRAVSLTLHGSEFPERFAELKERFAQRAT